MKQNARLDALTGLVFITCLIVTGIGLFSLGAVLFKDVYYSILYLALSLPLKAATALACLVITFFVTQKFRQRIEGVAPTSFFIVSASALSLSTSLIGWMYGAIYGIPVAVRILAFVAISVAIFVCIGWLQARRMSSALKWLLTAIGTAVILYAGLSNYYTSLTDTYMKDLRQGDFTVYLLPKGPDYPRITFFKPANGADSFAKGVEMEIEYKDYGRKSLTEIKHTGIDPVAACDDTETGSSQTHVYTCERLSAKDGMSIFRKTEVVTSENPQDSFIRYYYTVLIGQTQIDMFQGVYSEADARYPKPDQHPKDEQQLLAMFQGMRPASESELKKLISESQR